MASITRDEVRRLARLAKLRLSKHELAGYQQEFGQILEYVAQLQSVDVSAYQPTDQVLENEGRTRSDELHVDQIEREALLANAPDQQDGYIKVKRVL